MNTSLLLVNWLIKRITDWSFKFFTYAVYCLVAANIEKPWEKLGLSGVSPLAAAAAPLQQAASSSFAKSFRELPLRYRRKPLEQTEIEYIQVSTAVEIND